MDINSLPQENWLVQISFFVRNLSPTFFFTVDFDDKAKKIVKKKKECSSLFIPEKSVLFKTTRG